MLSTMDNSKYKLGSILAPGSYRDFGDYLGTENVTLWHMLENSKGRAIKTSSPEIMTGNEAS